MSKLKEKAIEFKTKAEQLRAKAESENRLMTDEELTEFDGYLSEVQKVQKQMEAEKRLSQFDDLKDPFLKDPEKVKPKEDERNDNEYMEAVRTYIRMGHSGLTPQQRSILNFHEGENGVGIAIDPNGTERRDFTLRNEVEKRAANSAITNPAYFKPTTLAEQFQATLKSVGDWMDAITVINDPAGNDLVLPYYDDAGTDGALEAEGTDAIASSTDLDAAKITLSNYWISSTGVKVGWSTLRDVNYPVEQFVIQPLMNRLARKLSYYGTIGTGSSQPKGIAIAAVTGELASKATYPTFTDLMNLIGMVDGAYDKGPKSGFMFHRSTALGIGKTVKSTTYNTDPLWQPSFAAGLPPTLLGYKYWFNNSMNLITTAPGNSVLFGDFSHFIMRMCGPLIITRLTERYAELGQVGFLISQYMDSNVDMVGTTYAPIKKIKNIMT